MTSLAEPVVGLLLPLARLGVPRQVADDLAALVNHLVHGRPALAHQGRVDLLLLGRPVFLLPLGDRLVDERLLLEPAARVGQSHAGNAISWDKPQGY